MPRLVGGLVRDLFREDAAAHYQDALAYAVPELESLETEFEWIERMADEGLRSTHNLAKAVQRELASASKEKLASHPSERSSGKHTVTPSRRKRRSTEVKPRRAKN